MLEILKDNLEAVIGEETEKELDSISSELALQQEALLEATREKSHTKTLQMQFKI